MTHQGMRPLIDVDDRIRFEAFIADSVLRFTAPLLPSDIEPVIEETLRELLGFLGADRCALIGGTPSERLSWVTCAACSHTDAADPLRTLDFAAAFPWQYARTCERAEPLAITSLSELPAEAEVDRRSAAEMGIRSMLTVAVHADEESPHCLMIQSSRAERTWAESCISRLPVLVRAFINALSRHRLEETRRLEVRHADVLESVGAIIWRADARTFQTTFVSREAESILGYPLESWMKVPDFWRTHIHPDDRAWVESFSSKAVQERRNHDFEYRMAVANGRIVWLRNIVKVIVENGEAVSLVGATVDITQRKQAEFEAAQLRHQLTHAGRVATMGHFAAALAHELNQPLGAVVSNGESALVFLGREPPLLDRVRAILDDIIRDGKRAGEIVHRMRTFLQERSFATQPLDLAALVNAVIGLARPLALSRQIDLRVDCEPRLPSYGDAVQIQQVLLNLIVNAVEAVGDQPPENRQIVLRGVRHGSSVELSVSDSGRGIPPDVMPHLFDPFFTTKADGLGMGLPISQAIIDAHGGRVDVENRPTGGAIVRVTLPAGGQRDQGR